MTVYIISVCRLPITANGAKIPAANTTPAFATWAAAATAAAATYTISADPIPTATAATTDDDDAYDATRP